ncbi:MAG: MobF family relaxase, partial [Acidimicrobiales bacterium]
MRIAKLAAGSQRYYLATVAAGEEDHRPAGLEPDGSWLGLASGPLGLSGPVQAPGLDAVLGGAHPGTGERLNPAQDRVRVVGFDLTFAAPKSVSVVFGVAGERVAAAVAAGHEAAVTDALGYLERAAVTARRRGDGRRWSVPTSGVVAAGFLHRTSRAADPHLHTHVLVANLVEGDDGRWTAMDGRGLYAHACTAGYLYQARLRLELTERLGLAFGPVANGVANVEGVQAPVLAHFSQRRLQVEGQLAALGAASPRAAQVAALATRPPKDASRTIESLRQEWQDRAEGLGLRATAVESLLHRAVPGPVAAPPELAPPELAPPELASELLGPGGLADVTGSFGRRDLLRWVAQRLGRGAQVAEIERLADQVVASGAVVERPPGAALAEERWRDRHGRAMGSGVAEPRWTPVAWADAERVLGLEAGRRAGTGLGLAGAEELALVIAERPWLDPAQVDAVRRLTTSGAGLELVRAGPGPVTGDVLEAARVAWERSGSRVLGLATSRAEAARLEAVTGILATVPPRGPPGPDGRDGAGGNRPGVIVVTRADEWGVRQLADLACRHEGAKIVLVADPCRRGPGAEALAAVARAVEPVVVPERLGPQRVELERFGPERLGQERLGQERAGAVRLGLGRSRGDLTTAGAGRGEQGREPGQE